MERAEPRTKQIFGLTSLRLIARPRADQCFCLQLFVIRWPVDCSESEYIELLLDTLLKQSQYLTMLLCIVASSR
jgi:hypothetical protein